MTSADEPDAPALATPEDRRLAYEIATQYELAIGNWRFQLLSIYLAAVGVIVGLGNSSRSSGALLLGITIGLLFIELRNRDLLRRYRPIGQKLEVVEEGILKGRKTDEQMEASVAFLFFNDKSLVGPLRRLVSTQAGIDTVFLTVIAYAIYLLAR